MADDKKNIVEPTVLFASTQSCEDSAAAAAAKSRVTTKKYVLIAVIALLVTGLAVTGVLVGIKIYTDSNLEIVKYSLKANGVSQNVTVDNNNAVTYHIQKDGLEAWILQDFDKGIQVTKQTIDGSSICYVSALNRSIAADASSIPDTTPNTDGASSTQVLYKVLPDPIVDLTFLGSKAAAMCKNIPTYHAVPECDNGDNTGVTTTNSTSAVGHRSKRTPRVCALWCTPNQPSCYCICGCCAMVCADFSQAGTVCTWYFNGKQWACIFYYRRLYAIYSFAPTCKYNNVTFNP